MTNLFKGDIVKITNTTTDKLGLISEVVDDTIFRVGKNWYNFEDYEIEVLHRELTQTS